MMTSGRPTDRTEFYNNGDAARIRSLFGKLPHAWKVLGEPIPFPEFRRAWNDAPISPEHKADLDMAWHRWLRFFGLRNDVQDYSWDNPDNPGRDNPDPRGPISPTLAELEHLQERERELYG